MRSLSTIFLLISNDLLESLKINYIVSSLKTLPLEYVYWPPDAIIICFEVPVMIFQKSFGENPQTPFFLESSPYPRCFKSHSSPLS